MPFAAPGRIQDKCLRSIDESKSRVVMFGINRSSDTYNIPEKADLRSTNSDLALVISMSSRKEL